jgi:hypothetical protein
MIAFGGLGRILGEAVAAFFKGLPRKLPGGTKENHEKSSTGQYSLSAEI